METKPLESHHITLRDRKFMQLSGIAKVVSLEPDRVELMTEQERLTIKGQDLHTEKLDMEKGELSLSGLVIGMIYSGGRDKKNASNVWKRLFR